MYAVEGVRPGKEWARWAAWVYADIEDEYCCDDCAVELHTAAEIGENPANPLTKESAPTVKFSSFDLSGTGTNNWNSYCRNRQIARADAIIRRRIKKYVDKPTGRDNLELLDRVERSNDHE